MKIIRAAALGMCFGVRDALALARSEAAIRPLTILGQLAHNPAVLADLDRIGIQMESDLARVQTTAVMITAHGASNRRINQLRQRGHHVIEATCPLVHVAHRALAQLAEAGHHPLIIGQRGHVEVVGLSEDYPDCDIVLSELDIDQLTPRPSWGVVAQTTQPVRRVRSLLQYLQHRFPFSSIHFRDTVCQPTKLRQEAAGSLASQCSVVIVVGGRQSNNTRELVETIRKSCPNVHQVESPDQVLEQWFTSTDTVGVTAGTSTPDELLLAVEGRLSAIGNRLLALAPAESIRN